LKVNLLFTKIFTKIIGQMIFHFESQATCDLSGSIRVVDKLNNVNSM